jgi:pimeloyl-ACP methyl ester carboxylesterase
MTPCGKALRVRQDGRMRESKEAYPAVDGVDIAHLQLDALGLEMHVATAGPAGGPVVLLLHGFPELWFSWRNQIPALAEAGYRVIAPDLRGYGRTDAPTNVASYTLLHIAGDLVGLLRAVGAPTCVAVGQDWGSPAATTLALCRPDLVRGIALLSTPYTPRTNIDFLADLSARLGPENYQVFFQEPGVAESMFETDVRATVIASLLTISGDAPSVHTTRDMERSAGVPDASGELPSWLNETAVDYLTSEFSRTGYRGALNWYRNHERNWELMPAWHETPIMAPAMFIGGDRDPVLNWPGFRQHVASLAERLMPGLVRNVILDGCGHWVPQERPYETNQLLLEFLDGLQPDKVA